MDKRHMLFQLIGFAILLGIGVIILVNQRKLLMSQEQSHQFYLETQSRIDESVRKSGLVYTMSNLLIQVERELENHPHRQLSPHTISRIASLSQALEPQGFSYLNQDSLKSKSYSPERGLLLMQLVNMSMASISFDSIKAKVDFSGAHLEKTELSGKDLTDIRLMCANLKNANLSESKLNGSDLRGANLWGTKLDNAELVEVKLNRAVMNWALLNGANLEYADLDGAKMINIELRNSNLSEAELQCVDLSGALMSNAIMHNVMFKWSNIEKANFSNANCAGSDFSGSNLSHAVFNGTDLKEARLNKVRIEKNDWLLFQDSLKILNAIDIQKKYRLLDQRNENLGYIIMNIDN